MTSGKMTKRSRPHDSVYFHDLLSVGRCVVWLLVWIDR